MARRLVCFLAAAVLIALMPGTAQASSMGWASAAQPQPGIDKGGRQVTRRTTLPKHVRLVTTPKSRPSSSALATTVDPPPSAVSGIIDASSDTGNVYSETAIAANPNNASQFMILSNKPTQNYMAAFNTTDGGAHWSQNAITPPSAIVPSPILAADPSVVFWGTNATAATVIAADSNFNLYGFLEIGSSTTGTFGPYSQCSGLLNGCVQFGNQPDKPFVTFDQRGVFDVTWDDNPANAPGSQPLEFVAVNSSSGGGLVWDSGGDIGGDIALVPNGNNSPTVYLTWLDYCGNTPTTVASQCGAPSGRLLIAKTTDDGLHWSRLDGTAVDVNCTLANFSTCGPSKITDLTTGGGVILPNYGGSCAMGCAPRPVESFPSMAIDLSGGTHNGRIYVAWADGAQRQVGTSTVPSSTRMHIYLSYFDPGVSTTWSTPVRLDSGNTNDAWQPTIAVDQSNGSAVASWYDRRDDTNNHLYRPYYAQSADGGATWSAQIPLTPNMSDPTIECNGTGDYFTIIAAGGHARAAWTDDSGSTPQAWTADIDESKLPATFASTTTTSTVHDPSGTSWKQLPGAARDVGIGPDSSCTITVIGTDSLAGGGGVYVWTGTRWIGPIAGGSGLRITGDPFGFMEVVTRSNAIYELVVNNTGHLVWVQLPGAGTDIASGADVSLWIVGTNAVGGGGGVWTFSGTSWSQPFGGGGKRIAVDPSGQPWIINSNHQIFCHGTNGWVQIPGSANDIGVGADGVVWVIGTNAVGGGFGIYQWSGTCSPAGSFSAVPGGGIAISVGTDGLPFVINNGGSIFERLF